MPRDADPRADEYAPRRPWLVLAAYGWLALFGIWPLAHPEHTTFGDPVTWLDLVLHLVGFSVVLPAYFRHLNKRSRRARTR